MVILLIVVVFAGATFLAVRMADASSTATSPGHPVTSVLLKMAKGVQAQGAARDDG